MMNGLQYLNIHGGLTFCKVFGNYTVFGFDCAHAGDENNPKLRDANYVMKLVEQMEQQILEYKKHYPKWLKYGRKRRLKLMDDINALAETKCEFGFGAMIGLLGGATEFDKK